MYYKTIRDYIEKEGIKFNVVAERAGLTHNTFSNMMNGKRKITVEEYVSICSALKVAPGTFIQT